MPVWSFGIQPAQFFGNLTTHESEKHVSSAGLARKRRSWACFLARSEQDLPRQEPRTTAYDDFSINLGIAFGIYPHCPRRVPEANRSPSGRMKQGHRPSEPGRSLVRRGSASPYHRAATGRALTAESASSLFFQWRPCATRLARSSIRQLSRTSPRSTPARRAAASVPASVTTTDGPNRVLLSASDTSTDASEPCKRATRNVPPPRKRNRGDGQRWRVRRCLT